MVENVHAIVDPHTMTLAAPALLNSYRAVPRDMVADAAGVFSHG